MGGPGSGFGPRYNRRRGRKRYVTELQQLSARLFPYRIMRQMPESGLELNLLGLQCRVYNDRIMIYNELGGARRAFRISLCKSKGNYGNFRYWLLCPNPECGRRCGNLYLQYTTDSTPLFACRMCWDLVYRTQHKSAIDRLIDKKWALVHKLEGNEFNSIANKPKGMHQTTFERIERQLEATEEAIWGWGMGKFGNMVFG